MKEKKISAKDAEAGVLHIWMARTARGDIDRDRLNVFCDSIARFGPTEAEWTRCVLHFVDTSDGSEFFPRPSALREWMAAERAKATTLIARARAVVQDAKNYSWTPEQRAEWAREFPGWKAAIGKIGKS